MPVVFIQTKLQTAEDEEIYRELAEFALTRASVDVANLALWLFSEGKESHAQQLVTDYCRQRPIRNTVDLILDVEGMNQPNPYVRHYADLAAQVRQVVAGRNCGDLLEFCTLYAEARQNAESKDAIVRLGDLSYRWFGYHRRFPGRVDRFFEVFDHLTAIGERGASVDLIRRTVTVTGIPSIYGEVIAESGREAEIRVLVTEFLGSVKRRGEPSFHLVVRQIAKAVGYSNPLMVELLLAGLCAVFETEGLSKVLVGSITSKYNTTVTDLILEAIVVHGLGREVRAYIAEEYGVLYDAGDGAGLNIGYSPGIGNLLEMLSRE